ncbi:MAG: hypothetical protein ACT4N5_08665 [Nitrosopumilaceae archaeon]
MALCCSPILAFAEEQTISVDFGKLYDITYDAEGVTVFEVIPSPDDFELIFEIDVSSPLATIELTIPRELLDSKEDGQDTDFFIIADGEDVTFTEVETTDTARTLFMELSPGTTELEIFGTELAGNTIQSEPVIEEPTEIPKEEIPPEEIQEPEPTEQVPEESPEEESSEEVEPVTEEKPSENIQNIFDFSKMPTWSIPINENQMYQFAMTAGVFIGLVIVLVALKGLRTEKSLP